MKENPGLDVGKPPGAQPQRETRRAQRILVVDDDADIRQLSTEVLLSFGYEVDAAEDGAVGWQALHANRYDLLITDNDMPKITGMELVQKARSAHMALPVILVSGAVLAEKLNQHSWLQLSATLQKPFTSDELLGAVKKVLVATEILLDSAPESGRWSSPSGSTGHKLPVISEDDEDDEGQSVDERLAEQGLTGAVREQIRQSSLKRNL